jgi:NitT/TauT family transport system substrate-binding protein
MRRNRTITIWVCSCGLVLLAAMGAAQPATADEKVTYRLKWVKNMSTAGDIYADVHGYFKDQGLNVEIKPGSPESDPVRELEMGQSDFGVVSADQAILACAKGAPIVVVAQLFQVNPLQWIYFEDKVKINGPADLKGKKIGVTFGKNDEIIMRTLMAQAGIKENLVELFSVRMDYMPFYQKRVDLWPVYINSQGVQIGNRLKQAGEKIGFFNPSDYGIKFVANSVVTSARIFEKQPHKVDRFILALVRGWSDAMELVNGHVTVDIVQRFDFDTPKEVLQAQLEMTRGLIRPNSNTVIGAIDVPAWHQTEQMMLSHGQIQKPVHVERILKTLVTQ